MTDITSATGTYHWYYNYLDIPYHGTFDVVDASSLSQMAVSNPNLPLESANAALIYVLANRGDWGGSGVTLVNIGTPIDGTSANNAVVVTSSSVGSVVAVGATYDTGTVQIYDSSITLSQTKIYSDTQVQTTTWTNHGWIYYAPTSVNGSPVVPPIPPDPPPTTLQIARTAPGYYIDNDHAVLPKYSNGVASIRAKFNNGTQIAVIKENSLGGFMIYEEVANAPSGNVFIYNPDRTLNDVIPAADIGQFLP